MKIRAALFNVETNQIIDWTVEVEVKSSSSKTQMLRDVVSYLERQTEWIKNHKEVKP